MAQGLLPVRFPAGATPRWPAPLAVTIVLLAGCAAPQEKAALPARPLQSATRVITLGTGTPNADPDRSGPATAIVVGDAVYLVDCGPGVVRRAAAAGLRMESLTHAFLTHLHSDHTAGLSDLIFTPWVLERSQPLELFGPPGTADLAEGVLAAYKEDIAMRIHGLEGANPTGYQVKAREIAPGVVYKDAHVTVKAFAVPHGSWKHAYGYRFEARDGKVIVISGDTTRSPAMAEHARGADLLIHEVYLESMWAKRPPKWKKYHQTFHTSSRDLARIAAQARPKLLVLHHVLLWGGREEDLLAEIRGFYKGPVVIAKDLQVFDGGN